MPPPRRPTPFQYADDEEQHETWGDLPLRPKRSSITFDGSDGSKLVFVRPERPRSGMHAAFPRSPPPPPPRPGGGRGPGHRDGGGGGSGYNGDEEEDDDDGAGGGRVAKAKKKKQRPNSMPVFPQHSSGVSPRDTTGRHNIPGNPLNTPAERPRGVRSPRQNQNDGAVPDSWDPKIFASAQSQQRPASRNSQGQSPVAAHQGGAARYPTYIHRPFDQAAQADGSRRRNCRVIPAPAGPPPKPPKNPAPPQTPSPLSSDSATSPITSVSKEVVIGTATTGGLRVTPRPTPGSPRPRPFYNSNPSISSPQRNTGPQNPPPPPPSPKPDPDPNPGPNANHSGRRSRNSGVHVNVEVHNNHVTRHGSQRGRGRRGDDKNDRDTRNDIVSGAATTSDKNNSNNGNTKTRGGNVRDTSRTRRHDEEYAQFEVRFRPARPRGFRESLVRGMQTLFPFMHKDRDNGGSRGEDPDLFTNDYDDNETQKNRDSDRDGGRRTSRSGTGNRGRNTEDLDFVVGVRRRQSEGGHPGRRRRPSHRR
ncbi:hypothetical protein F4808DRAFT_287720 [Astrocystis sublimbata]|nr:hypothetical protein F4808DRAFT_287720 [Astrocystis sublimbata]